MEKIKGFDNYFVTEEGKVWSVKRGIFLAGGEDEDGYLLVSLRQNGEQFTKYIHRIVAETFLPNPENLPVVHHKDNVKQNNCVENLMWCDVSYNTKEAYKAGVLNQKGEKNNACKYSDRQVVKIVEGYAGGSIAEYARSIDVEYSVVYSYLKRLRRS